MSSKGGRKQWIGARVLPESQGSVYRSGGSHRHARKQDKGMELQRSEAVGSAVSQCPKDIILFPALAHSSLDWAATGGSPFSCVGRRRGVRAGRDCWASPVTGARQWHTHPTQGSSSWPWACTGSVFPDEKVILSPGCMHWLRKASRTTASDGLVAALCAWEKAIHSHVPLCETQVAWEFERGIFTARIHVGSLPKIGIAAVILRSARW